MASSYNGWPVLPNSAGHLDNSVIPGTDGIKFAPGVLAGDVATVLFFVGFWLNRNIEAAAEGCWGYSYRENRNAANWSCHASATAADYNAPKHPNGKVGNYNPAQVAAILDFTHNYLENVVCWGGDWGPGSTPDWMHFEINSNAADVARVAAKILRDYGPRETWADGAAPAPAPAPAAPAPASGFSAQAKTDQGNLLDTGFDPKGVDGYWGAGSQDAARRFQRAAGIATDGIMGDVTRGKMRLVPSWHGAPDVAGTGGYSDLRWQQELKKHGWRIETDGAWGPHSKSILAQFQADKHLAADGVRGPESWTALFTQPN